MTDYFTAEQVYQSLKEENAALQKVCHEQQAELETMRAKLKTHEDLGDAGSDMQLLRMGYAAARLEIESLKAQLHAAKQINAAQFGLLAASIPGSALRTPHGQAPASTSGDFIRRTNEDYAAWCATEYTPEFNSKGPDLHGLWAWQEQQRRMDDLLRQAPIDPNCKSEQKRLATLWGFVPAQAAPAYKDSTPELHIGDSAFESWYSTYSPVHKSDKQRARDAYAAGMGDPLVTAAPVAVVGPSEAVAYLDIGTGGYLDLGTDLSDEAVSRLPKGRHALVIAGTYGIDGYTAAPTTQPSPAVQGDALDAARYRWLREGNDAKHGAAWHVAVNLYGCEWDAAIDAALAAQEGK